MIILPDRNIPRSRFLLPVSNGEWRIPSAAQPKDEGGKENRTRFSVTARLSDGYIKWRGWFDDRNDFDAFLFALVAGSLRYERELWDLPVPVWRPDIGEDLHYDFLTVTTLTTPAGSNQTYNIPTDWNALSNTVEGVGGGAGGLGGSNGQSGGGGGAWSRSINLSLPPGGTATWRIGSGGAGSSSTTGNAGGDTWFNDTAFPTTGQRMGAKGSPAAIRNATSPGGSSAGAYVTGTGAGAVSGGSGGAGADTSANSGSGGGGAGAINGNGANGAATQAISNAAAAGGGGNSGGTNGSQTSTTTGGNGGDNGGGTGHGVGTTTAPTAASNGGGGAGGGTGGSGINPGGVGSDGTDMPGSIGSGGGGGGGGLSNTVSNAANGANGGLYGGGGGGSGQRLSGTGTGGAGRQGAIAITYTPSLLNRNRGYIIG